MEPELPQQLKETGAYLNIVKVAVAVAILRDKPEDVSGEEHTKYLQLLCQKTGNKWRNRAQELEEELLRLKQESLLANLLDDPRRHQVLQAESQGEVDISLTPPCSSEETRSKGSAEVAIKQHTNFLSSVARLKGLAKNGESGEERLNKVIRDSILVCLKHIRTFLTCCESFPIPVKNVLHVTQLMGSVVSLPSLDKTITGDIVEEIMIFVDDLLEKIITQDSLYCETLFPKETTSQLIVNLGKSKTLCPGLIGKVTTKLTNYSEKLRAVKFGNSMIDPVEFENMYHVFKIIEELLVHVLNENLHAEEIGIFQEDELQKFEDLFDDSLLHIAEDFPMFSHYVWKLKGLLSDIIGSRLFLVHT